jgi:peroxiredoxin Q/BCP
MVEEGQPAPDFELRNDTGESMRLSGFRGSPVVLYFYPKDDTAGCTAQACGIRDEFDAFRRMGAVVLGVSPDSESSHRAFREKYDLPFTLLADPDHEVAERYSVWVERERGGQKHMGIERTTFVVDPDGTLTKIMRRVDPQAHADDVLAALAG